MSGFIPGQVAVTYSLASGLPVELSIIALSVFPIIGLSIVDRFLGGEDQTEEMDQQSQEDDDFFDDDEIGGMDEVDDWEEGEFEDDESTAPDLEPRLDELENEVAGISSTVSTVRSENEAISDTVGEVEENVRKLLDIYEMVTRGVNPFVDESGAEAFDSDSFGLFENDGDVDDDEQGEDELMDAEADSFFDDDFEEESDEPDAEEPEIEDVEDLSPKEDSELPEDESGKSFDELKAEYDSGEAEWPEDDELDVDDEQFEFENTDNQPSEDTSEEGDEDLFDETIDADQLTESQSNDSAGRDDTASHSVDSTENGSQSGNGAKPYLRRIPAGYTTDLVLMEWMEYLRRHADTAETIRAIEYYQNIDWITDDVADHLVEIVVGHGTNGNDSKHRESDLSELTIDHHTHSLEFISRLDGNAVDIEMIKNWPGPGE